ncbi:glycosyltransferase [Campylobacter showae]|uniref:glycosyltransferase n=1 Tax=Campylobacter showae TaxID=204 RepID=UPI0028D30A8F|nr:glycosyltransferase [Campylobacter showae]
MRTAVLTTVFPANRLYLIDFFNSLKEQTYKNFDIVVVNDGFDGFEDIARKYSKELSIVELKYSNTPAKNREWGINYCIEKGYDILVFGDSDDYFAKNRIEKSLELLEDNDIVVNDLSLFDETGIYDEGYLSNRVRNRQIIDFEFIKDKNIFGLSNSAMGLKCLDKILIDENILAVDWYIFSHMLLDDKKAIFTNETVSYYRQYEKNMVGLGQLTEVVFQKFLYVKRKHYESLKQVYPKYIFELEKLNDIGFADLRHINYPLWWELI